MDCEALDCRAAAEEGFRYCKEDLKQFRERHRATIAAGALQGLIVTMEQPYWPDASGDGFNRLSLMAAMHADATIDALVMDRDALVLAREAANEALRTVHNS